MTEYPWKAKVLDREIWWRVKCITDSSFLKPTEGSSDYNEIFSAVQRRVTEDFEKALVAARSVCKNSSPLSYSENEDFFGQVVGLRLSEAFTLSQKAKEAKKQG